jgi:hypothetical protein
LERSGAVHRAAIASWRSGPSWITIILMAGLAGYVAAVIAFLITGEVLPP